MRLGYTYVRTYVYAYTRARVHYTMLPIATRVLVRMRIACRQPRVQSGRTIMEEQ